MSGAWRPKLAPGAQLTSLPLSPAEGFAVSRIDGNTTAREIALLTGLGEAQVNELLTRLEAVGVVEARPEAAALPADAPLVEAEVLTEPEAEESPPPEEESPSNATLLALFREKLYPLPGGDREQLASTSTDVPTLSALCYDPLPAVVRALLQNPRVGPEQARLIAAHHHSSTGLELLINRGDLARDGEVQRKLWRNPQLTEGQVKRLTATKRLLEIWKLSVSRESTAQTRAALSRTLRTKFQAAPAEERVELIFNTEGRPLTALAGIPIDGRTTSLLCGRTYSSMLLVQNIAHWSVAPPALIGHLLKQPMVMRQQRIKKLLEQHPNAPRGHV